MKLLMTLAAAAMPLFGVTITGGTTDFLDGRITGDDGSVLRWSVRDDQGGSVRYEILQGILWNYQPPMMTEFTSVTGSYFSDAAYSGPLPPPLIYDAYDGYSDQRHTITLIDFTYTSPLTFIDGVSTYRVPFTATITASAGYGGNAVTYTGSGIATIGFSQYGADNFLQSGTYHFQATPEPDTWFYVSGALLLLVLRKATMK